MLLIIPQAPQLCASCWIKWTPFRGRRKKGRTFSFSATNFLRMCVALSILGPNRLTSSEANAKWTTTLSGFKLSVTDHGTLYTRKFMNELVKEMYAQQHLRTLYVPWINDKVERLGNGVTKNCCYNRRYGPYPDGTARSSAVFENLANSFASAPPRPTRKGNLRRELSNTTYLYWDAHS